MHHNLTTRLLAAAQQDTHAEKEPLSSQPDLASQMVATLHDFSEDDRYWSIDDIAAFVGTSKSTIRRNFICDPRWPLPIRTSTAENSRQRWLASEVKKALLLFRRR
ncbi:MAG: hypothetical protein Q4A06_05800 [Cardiobacteriaceae bacterium]|nr:hypothetical protein [Cardiobacteriaceae bacterium]